MRRETRWWLTLVLTLLMLLSGCDISRQSSQSSLSDNGRFMELWSTYAHCYRSGDLDEMRADAQQLNRAIHTIDFVENPIASESNELDPLGPTSGLSVDPARWLPPVPFMLASPSKKWGTWTLHERCISWSPYTFHKHATSITRIKLD